MTTLREEYNKNKAKKNAAVQEAAISWVMENVVLLNEGFNRESLMRLQAAISKFDSTFAPYGTAVPEVKRSLDDAVELLNRITMGEKITRKDGRLKLTDEETEGLQDPATYMVKYMSLLYNNLSRFFNKDMKVLIELPIFKMARENPQVPLKDLIEAPRMKKAILHALIPSPEVTAILSRMYRSMELPNLEYELIADQMLNLTASNFAELSKMDKVPLVVSAPQAPEPKVEEATGANPKVTSGDEMVLSEEEGQALLKEIGEINPDQIKKIADSLTKIQNIIRAFPELQATNQALDNLRKQALGAISKNEWGGTKGAFIAAQANMVYSYFDKLGDLWPKIKPFFDDQQITDEELEQMAQLINRSQGGMVQKLMNFFKSRPVPALSPQNITNAIIQVLKAGQTSGNPQSAMQSMENFMTRLAQLKLPPAVTPQGQPIQPAAPVTPQAPTSSAGSQSSAPANTSTQTQPSAPAQPAAASPQAPQQTQQNASGGMNPVEIPEIVNQAGQAMGVDPSSPMFQQQMNKLIQAGWKLIPPGR